MTLRKLIVEKLTALGFDAVRLGERLSPERGLTDLQLRALTTRERVRGAFRRVARLTDSQSDEIAALVLASAGPVEVTPPSLGDRSGSESGIATPRPHPLRQAAAHNGGLYASMFDRFSPCWTGHLEASRAFILAGAHRVACKDSVTVLGASEARDIPVATLARDFASIRLVDIDEPSLQRAIASLQGGSPDCPWENISLHIEDITGGRLTDLVAKALTAIRSAKDPHSAHEQVVNLYATYDPAVSWASLDHLRASYVISSGVASQFLPLVNGIIGTALQERFSPISYDRAMQANYAKGRDDLLNRVITQHAATLAMLTTEDGLVYWSDTIADSPDFSKLAEPERLTLWQSLLDFLRDPSENQWMATEIQGAFRRLLDPHALPSFLVNLLKENRFPSEKMLALIGRIVDEASRINPVACDPIIPGGLPAYFGDCLVPDGPCRSWRWVLNPLKLTALQVQAFHLRRSQKDFTGRETKLGIGTC